MTMHRNAREQVYRQIDRDMTDKQFVISQSFWKGMSIAIVVGIAFWSTVYWLLSSQPGLSRITGGLHD